MQREREYIHSWYLLLMTSATLDFLLLSTSLAIDLALACLILFFFLKNGLSFRRLLKIALYAFLFSGLIFLLTILNPNDRDRQGSIYTLGPFVFFRGSIDKASLTMLRVFFASFISIGSSAAIDYTKVLLHLIVHKGLKLIWGYPILLAINSMTLLKEEYDRIKLNAHLRQLPWRDRVFHFFPLLVFAIRHSQRGALSLITRGLNETKTFYFTYDLSGTDRKRLFLFWVFYFGLVVLSCLTLR